MASLLKIKDKVKNLLETNPDCRESDLILIGAIWKEELSRYASFADFLEKFESGLMPNTESIRRARQKLQSLYPHLRGENNEWRKTEEKRIKEELRTFIN